MPKDLLDDPHKVLEMLRNLPPLSLESLPVAHGIYALWDHVGQPRYIGITNANNGFLKRVCHRHVTGTERRSHKFGQAYCVGRMWRDAKQARGTSQEEADARKAKELRNTFIRQFCSATIVPMAFEDFAQLQRLEQAVQDLAPPAMRVWEGIRFAVGDEPRDLVDQVLARMSNDFKAAVERQGARYQALRTMA